MTEGIISNPELNKTPEGTSEHLDIYGGDLGFTYTIDRGLSGALQHGLLSRQEERKRGLHVRVRESRSPSDTIYFTTLANDVYARNNTDEPKAIDELMEDVVGIAIDRPDYAKNKDGHFGVQNFVEPEKFRALVFIDQQATSTDVSAYGKPAFRFGDILSEEKIDSRVKSLRQLCEDVGRDTPIYGVSGKRYWPLGTGNE